MMSMLTGVSEIIPKVHEEHSTHQLEKVGKLSGRLIHPNKIPLSGVKVILFTQNEVSDENLLDMPLWTKVESTVTDFDGKFSFTHSEGFEQYKHIKLVVKSRFKDVEGVFALFKRQEIAIHSIKAPFSSKEYTFATRYLEFDKDRLFPNDSDQIPSPYKNELLKNILKSGIGPVLTALFQTKLKTWSTVEDVQEHFDKLYSRQPLKHNNKIVSEMIHDWLAPTYYKTENGDLMFELNFDAYRNGDKNGAEIPNVKVFMKNEKNELSIKEIIVEFPEQKPVSYKAKSENQETKEEESSFVEGLKILACLVLLAAEIKHLGKAHLGLGFMVQIFFRCFSVDHPLYKPMENLLSEPLFINKEGKDLILGKIGMFKQTAISEHIVQALKDVNSIHDYFMIPSAPLNAKDFRAERENIFYDAAYKTATDIVKNRWDELKEKKHWRSVYNASWDMVHNSQPYIQQDFSQAVNFSESERAKKLDRQKGEDGKLRNFRPMTLNPDGPDDGDQERLILWLAYMIYLVYLHDYLHKLQKVYAVDLSFASMAPRFSKKDAPCFGTDKEAGATQLATAWTLVNADIRGTITNYPVKEFQDHFGNKKVIQAFKDAHGNLEEVEDTIQI